MSLQDDTGVLMLKSAFELSQFHQVAVLAEDIDAVVIFLHYAGKAKHKIQFTSEKTNIWKKTFTR